MSPARSPHRQESSFPTRPCHSRRCCRSRCNYCRERAGSERINAVRENAMDESSTVDVRRIAAALAHAETRVAYAKIVLSAESAETSRTPSVAKQQRTLEALIGSGLIA